MIFVIEVDFLDFSKAVYMFSHSALGKMSSIQLYKAVAHWVHNWLVVGLSVTVNGVPLGWWPVTSGAPQAQLFL